MTKKFFNRL